MRISLIPDILFRSYDQIQPGWLRQQGITLLLTDLDYTLASKKTREPDPALRRWIRAMSQENIRVMIVSNNRSSRRVTDFCVTLGISYQGHARKPNPRGLYVAMARAGVDAAHTAMLGDKLLTDVLAAHRAGVLSLMVEPVGGPVTLWQKILHAMQAPFKACCKRDLRRQ